MSVPFLCLALMKFAVWTAGLLLYCSDLSAQFSDYSGIGRFVSLIDWLWALTSPNAVYLNVQNFIRIYPSWTQIHFLGVDQNLLQMVIVEWLFFCRSHVASFCTKAEFYWRYVFPTTWHRVFFYRLDCSFY